MRWEKQWVLCAETKMQVIGWREPRTINLLVAILMGWKEVVSGVVVIHYCEVGSPQNGMVEARGQEPWAVIGIAETSRLSDFGSMWDYHAQRRVSMS
jgi:hypothetical protein